jgi:DNA-directed RNA polymerase specialized sigma24 family protein
MARSYTYLTTEFPKAGRPAGFFVVLILLLPGDSCRPGGLTSIRFTAMAPITLLRLPNHDPAQLRQALLADRAVTLTRLYQQAFPLVRRLVLRQGGSPPDAQDVFQDALVIFYEQAVGGSLILTAAASTYLVGISQNLWRHELRRRQRHIDLNEAHTELPDTDAAADTEASASVLSYVEQLGSAAATSCSRSTTSSSRWSKLPPPTSIAACARPRCRSSNAWSACARPYGL